MSFWDLFVQRVILSFWPASVSNRCPSCQILSLALDRGLFTLAVLNDASFALAVLRCGNAPKLGDQLRGKFLHRNPNAQALLPLVPPDLRPLTYAATNRQNYIQRGLLAEYSIKFYAGGFARYKSRLALKNVDFTEAEVLIREAVWDWSPVVAAATGGDIQVELFCRDLRRMWMPGLPNGWPTPPPSWRTKIPHEERFIDAALRLSVAERVLVYLCLYAGLDIEQIYWVVLEDFPRVTRLGVKKSLYETWVKVIGKM